jgi:hypothetical protein
VDPVSAITIWLISERALFKHGGRSLPPFLTIIDRPTVGNELSSIGVLLIKEHFEGQNGVRVLQ